MNLKNCKTYYLRKEDVKKRWLLIDATDKPLGRLCSQVAFIVRGKHKPSFTPSVDCGDNVIIVNASKVLLTGSKLNDKKYITHTGYPGGQRVKVARELMKSNLVKFVRNAVGGMLMKGRNGRSLRKNFYVFHGEKHDKMSHKPEPYTLKY